jgi:prophage regulatory protein
MAKVDRSKLPETGFLRLWQVQALIPVCKTTWWQGVADGKYPKPVKLAARVTAWKVEDIRKLIEELGR